MNTTDPQTRPRLAMSLAMSGDPAAPLPTRAQLLAQRGPAAPVKASEASTDDVDDVEDTEDTDDAGDAVEAARSVTPARAGRIVRAAKPTEIHPGRAVQLMLAAQRGDTGAARELQAAAGDLDVTKLAGLLPPQYSERIIGDVPARRRVFDHAVAHEGLWSTGMTLEVPTLTDDVQGGWIAVDGGSVPTDDMAIGFTPVAVKLWGHAAKASYSLVERSAPSFVAAYYRRAIASFYRDVETDLTTTITGAAQASSIVSTVPVVADLFEMAAEVLEHSDAAGCDADADVALCAPGVWSALMSSARADAPAFSGGQGDAHPSVGNIAGITIVAVPKLPAGTLLVGDSQSVRAYGGQSEAMRLAALVVGVAQWQHGVLAEFAHNVENTKGWVKHTFTAAPAARRATSK